MKSYQAPSDHQPIQPVSNISFIARIRSPIEEEENIVPYTNRQSSFDATHQNYNKTPIQSQTFTTPLNTSYISTKENAQSKSSTLFTLNSKSQTNLIITTQKALGNKFIQTNLTSLDDLEVNKGFLLKQYKSSFFELDRVYNDSQSLDTIYIEQIKDRINNMFIGVNSCILLFGATNSGKTYVLRGGRENNGNGILDRSVQDMFNLLDINRNYELKIRVGISAVLNNSCYDLLSYTNEQKKNNISNDSNLGGDNLNKVIILNKREFDVCYLDAMEKLEKIKKNEGSQFNIVISCILEDNSRSRTEISKIDFVKLVASEYGLPDSPTDELTGRERDVDHIETMGNNHIFISQQFHNNNEISTIKQQYSGSYNKMLSNELYSLSNLLCDREVVEEKSSNSNNLNYINNFNNKYSDCALVKILRSTIQGEFQKNNSKNKIIIISCLIPNVVPPVDSQNVLKVNLINCFYFNFSLFAG